MLQQKPPVQSSVFNLKKAGRLIHLSIVSLITTLGLMSCNNVLDPDDMVSEFTPPDVNQAPRAVASIDTRVESGDLVTMDGSLSNDPDGSIQSFAWAQTIGPQVTLDGANTSSASFTAPDVTEDTLFTFELVVTDNENATARTVADVMVEPMAINRPPVANAGIDFTASISSTVTLDGSASSDPDGDNINFLWVSEDSSIALANANQAIATFSAPNVATLTTYNFTLTVTDTQGLTNADSVTVSIDPVFNTPPVANAGNDQTVMGTDPVVLNGSASSDSDGTIAAYLWEQTAGPTVTIQNATQASANFTAPDVSSTTVLTFRLTVTDDNNAIDTDTVDITVNQLVNDAPNADAGPDLNANGFNNEFLDGSASSDNDGQITGYQWSQLTGTPVTINNSQAQVATFETPNETEALTFQLTVTDNRGATGSDNMDVTVTPIAIDANCSTHPGFTQWTNTCASCHGAQNNGGSRAAADLNNLIGNGTMANATDIDGLLGFVTDRMPPPGAACVGTCSYRTSRLLLDLFNNVCTF